MYGENGELTDRCLGFIGDSESANKKAMSQLETEYTYLVNIVCQAHGLSSLLKVTFQAQIFSSAMPSSNLTHCRFSSDPSVPVQGHQLHCAELRIILYHVFSL